MVFTAAPPAGQTLHFCIASSVFYSADRFSLLVVDHQQSEQIQKHCSALWVMYEMYQPHLFPESAAASCGIKGADEDVTQHTETSRIFSTFPALLFHQNQLLSSTPSSTNMAA